MFYCEFPVTQLYQRQSLSVWLSGTQRETFKYFSNTLKEKLSNLSIFQSDVKVI